MLRRLSEYRSEIITVPAAVRISMQSSPITVWIYWPSLCATSSSIVQ
jgi:hypothetical protein